VVEAVEGGVGQVPGQHREAHRDLGRQGGEDVPEREDPGRAQPADPPFQRGQHQHEPDRERRDQPARDPQRAADQHQFRRAHQVRHVRAGALEQGVHHGGVGVRADQ
jgi:hypothetical protein